MLKGQWFELYSGYRTTTKKVEFEKKSQSLKPKACDF